MHSRSLILILIPLSLLAVGATCDGPDPVDLEIDDKDRFSPGGRISYEFLPGVGTRREGALVDLMTPSSGNVNESPVTARSAGIKGTIAVDSAIANVKGSDHQHLVGVETVEALGVIATAPTRLKVSSDNLRGRVAARGGVRFHDVLSLEAIIGLAVDRTEIKLQDGVVGAKETDSRAGFLIGNRVTIRPIALFDLYGEYTRTYSNGNIEVYDAQVGLDLNVTRNISLFGGYRWWKYKEGHSRHSDLEFDFRGPTAGASLKF